MKNLKTNLPAKITAFVLLQIFLTMTVLSGIIVVFNADTGWYSSNKNEVSKDIFFQVACNADAYMSGYLLDSDLITDYESEIFYGENQASGFGYTISQITEKGKSEVRKLHSKLAEREDIYMETFEHSEYEVSVYLGNPEKAAAGTDIFPQELRGMYELYSKMYTYRHGAVAVGCGCLAVSLALFVFLMVAAGYGRTGERAALKKVPQDLLAAACVLIILLFACVVVDTVDYRLNENYDIIILAGIASILGVSIVITGFFTIFAARVKMGSWWRSTFIYQAVKKIVYIGKLFWKGLKSLVRQIPMIWKTILGLIVFFVLNLVISVNMYYSTGACFLWLLEALAASAGVIYTALLLKRLKEGGRHLAEGDLDYKISQKGMFLDLAEHADNLNSIGKGMSAAVEEKIKSERLKAELITNVSHDIKTPLTSIINYVDFLRKEDIQDETIKGYVDVLERQSRRLKKLTEDLVDASKASTGNVKIDLAPCQVGVLLEQVMGEYKEKAEKNDLRFVMTLPEEDLEILADGRRLWRVFDNLLNNICKYSQPGTRVYMNLEKEDDRAVITYRNTSKYELNITAEELTERFVRGDSSRHTEGSGLGLSIARDLTQLQGGSFDIYIDGDLFKVRISFDLISL